MSCAAVIKWFFFCLGEYSWTLPFMQLVLQVALVSNLQLHVNLEVTDNYKSDDQNVEVTVLHNTFSCSHACSGYETTEW